MRIAVLWTMLAFAIPGLVMSAQPAFTVDVLLKLARIEDAQLSPDGKLVAFTVHRADMGTNTVTDQIYVVSIDGGVPQQLTNAGSNTRPRWSADSKRIFFVSDRANGHQIWTMNADGSAQTEVTNLATGAEGVTLSHDGKWMLMTSALYPECEAAEAAPGVAYDAACNKRRLDEDAGSKMEARTADSLLYRHWTEYRSKRRRHLLIAGQDGSNVRDLTPGVADGPPFSLDGPEPYVFSPDSTQVVYVANAESDPGLSSNSDLFLVPVSAGAAKRLTTNPGSDEGPVFSPDGKYLAYRTQTRAGFDGDQWRLAVMDMQSGKMNTLADSLDRWVEEYTWSPNSKYIFFTIEDHGTTPLMSIPVQGGAIRTVAQGPTTISGIQFTPDDQAMIYAEQSGSYPVEIKKALAKGGAGIALTHLNDGITSAYELTPFDTFDATAADGTRIQSFMVKPPGFDPTRKYPILFLIHGGPESAFRQSWTYRWNAQVFAGAGYLVVMPNPRGSTGYGQAFTDAVIGDWGGKPYDDIMAVVDNASNLPYADKDRMVAAGASYGGYMVDWILGHTDRFRALVSHAGVYDTRSWALTTDELWFVKSEFQGFPWEDPDLYEKWSPSAFAKNFKTPTLVTQGEIDYRVPIGQGEQLFTTLQVQKVPSRLIQFPGEGHWIVKPQDSRFWYHAVLEWLNRYTRPNSASTEKPAS
jgi:dipeptidyl aminopeptidase/acylaminoacyl peptidase